MYSFGGLPLFDCQAWSLGSDELTFLSGLEMLLIWLWWRTYHSDYIVLIKKLCMRRGWRMNCYSSTMDAHRAFEAECVSFSATQHVTLVTTGIDFWWNTRFQCAVHRREAAFELHDENICLNFMLLSNHLMRENVFSNVMKTWMPNVCMQLGCCEPKKRHLSSAKNQCTRYWSCCETWNRNVGCCVKDCACRQHWGKRELFTSPPRWKRNLLHVVLKKTEFSPRGRAFRRETQVGGIEGSVEEQNNAQNQSVDGLVRFWKLNRSSLNYSTKEKNYPANFREKSLTLAVCSLVCVSVRTS